MQKPPDLDSNGKSIISKPPDLDVDGKPPDLDHNHNTVDDTLAAAHATLDASNKLDSTPVSTPQSTPDEGFFSHALHGLTAPLTTLPSQATEYLSRKIDPNHGDSGLRSIASAYLESLGHMADSLSSPLNLGMAAVSGGASLAGRAGLEGLAGGLATAGRVANLGVAGEGAYHALTQPATAGKLSGIAELATGALGARSHMPEANINEPLSNAKPDLTTPLIPENKPNIEPLNVDESTGEIHEPDLDKIDFDNRNRIQSNLARIALSDEKTGNIPRKDLYKITSNPVPNNINPDVLTSIQKNGITEPISITLKRNGNNPQSIGIYSDDYGTSGELTIDNFNDLQKLAAAKKLGIENIPVKFNGKLRDSIDPSTMGAYNKLYDTNGNLINNSELSAPSPDAGIPKFNSPKLPRDLSSAKPRFNIGTDSYQPQFESDLDKALYVVAQKKPSSRNDDYMKFIQDSTGMTPVEAMDAGIQVRSQIKNIVSGSDPGVVQIPTLYKPKALEATPERITSAPTLDNEDVGQASNKPPVIFVKSNDNSPQIFQNAIKAGYKFDSVTPDNRIRMIHQPDAPIQPPSPANDIGNGGDNSDEPPVNNDSSTEPSKVKFGDILNIPRAAQIGNLHLSAPFRQGLPLITTKSWWTSWNSMFKAMGSEEGYKNVMQSIQEHPNFQPTGEGGKSFAEESGLRLSDSLSNREENLGSKLLEKIPMGVGNTFRASNRAFTAYLNKLRSDTFNDLIDSAQTLGLNPKQDMVLSRNIAGFVNNATGRGSLGKLEKYADGLNTVFFSPRKIAGEVQMLNPANYITADPFVRKQYLKAMFSNVGAWMTVAGAAKLAGADVSMNPTNSDFGKIKIGNTRIDPSGGLQPFLTLAARQVTGQTTSSITNKTQDLGMKFGSPTRMDIAEDFGANKLNTPIKFAYDWMNASKARSFNVTDQTARMFVPIFAQDIIELAKENPKLIPWAIPAAFGMGTQIYDKSGRHTVIPNSMSFKVQ